MIRTAISQGIYRDEYGTFWVRPTVNGKRTWRKLKAGSERFALKEGREKLVAQERAMQGTGRDPFARGETFAEMATLYLTAHCPNRKLEARNAAFCKNEEQRLDRLKLFFGSQPLASIKLVRLPEYKKWRIARLKRNTSGERTVDLDLCTLSNVMNYAVAIGSLDFNYIRVRPRFRSDRDVDHCRQFAPQSADEVHAMADFFLEDPRSESQGWLTLFDAMSGCRISELLRLRTDATSRDHPGYIERGFLFIRRSKKGINPFILITEEFQTMLVAFWNWHKTRFPKGSPWFFPGRSKDEPIRGSTFSHAIPRCAKALGLPHRKAHGFRSFYVTKRRSDGVSDTRIAKEIGDKTVALMEKSYGAVPENWVGGEPLSFIPKKREPAWNKWLP